MITQIIERFLLSYFQGNTIKINLNDLFDPTFRFMVSNIHEFQWLF
jgi:hypothetical protein